MPPAIKLSKKRKGVPVQSLEEAAVKSTEAEDTAQEEILEIEIFGEEDSEKNQIESFAIEECSADEDEEEDNIFDYYKL